MPDLGRTPELLEDFGLSSEIWERHLEYGFMVSMSNCVSEGIMDLPIEVKYRLHQPISSKSTQGN
jgi:hypothetical protein